MVSDGKSGLIQLLLKDRLSMNSLLVSIFTLTTLFFFESVGQQNFNISLYLLVFMIVIIISYITILLVGGKDIKVNTNIVGLIKDLAVSYNTIADLTITDIKKLLGIINKFEKSKKSINSVKKHTNDIEEMKVILTNVLKNK